MTFISLAAQKFELSDLLECNQAFRIGRQLYLLGYVKEAYEYLNLAVLRHPFSSEYELWHHISKIKLQLPPSPFISPIHREPALVLYYKTLADLENKHKGNALKRLKQVIKKDSHDSMANHLLNKYFNQPLDERHFFPTPEGL